MSKIYTPWQTVRALSLFFVCFAAYGAAIQSVQNETSRIGTAPPYVGWLGVYVAVCLLLAVVLLVLAPLIEWRTANKVVPDWAYWRIRDYCNTNPDAKTRLQQWFRDANTDRIRWQELAAVTEVLSDNELRTDREQFLGTKAD